MIRPLLVLLLGSLATGCGGSVASVPSDSSDGGMMSDSDKSHVELAGPLEGSYDIAFGDVVITPGTNGIPQPEGTPPSVGATARLDLRAKSSGAYDAVITSRWGEPAAFTVTVTNAALILEGGRANVQGTTSGNYGTDSWTKVTLARAAGGSLSGAFSASGTEQVGQGDVIWENDVAAKGSLARDVTPPETKPVFYSNGPSDGLLPWDAIRVRVAEPTDAAKLVSAFTVNAPDAHPAAIDWKTEGGTANADWVGAIQA
ncbi:MAG: hypothetical protein ABIP39_01575, partial [Polyangiaceae bacterium]